MDVLSVVGLAVVIVADAWRTARANRVRGQRRELIAEWEQREDQFIILVSKKFAESGVKESEDGSQVSRGRKWTCHLPSQNLKPREMINTKIM